MGNAESNESAAVKRQAEGFSNPMYRLLDLGVRGFLLTSSSYFTLLSLPGRRTSL